MEHMQTVGPQCNLYVPAPILQHGENVVVSTDFLYKRKIHFLDASMEIMILFERQVRCILLMASIISGNQ